MPRDSKEYISSKEIAAVFFRTYIYIFGNSKKVCLRSLNKMTERKFKFQCSKKIPQWNTEFIMYVHCDCIINGWLDIVRYSTFVPLSDRSNKFISESKQTPRYTPVTAISYLIIQFPFIIAMSPYHRIQYQGNINRHIRANRPFVRWLSVK